MIIQMLANMSSGRHDGRVWPPAWTDFEVPDWEGRDLVAGGNAIFVADSWPAAPEPEPVSEPLPHLHELPESEPESVSEPEEEPVQESPGGPPRPAAPKADWVDWAMANGVGEDEANGMTKQQLMELYGQRP